MEIVIRFQFIFICQFIFSGSGLISSFLHSKMTIKLEKLSSFHSGESKSNTARFMVFDFIRKRAEEGINQVSNIASKSLEGKLGEALLETKDYIQLRQKKDAENFRKITNGLARSRDQLLSDISKVFSISSDSNTDQIAQLENILLSADLGTVTTAAILSDVAAYAKSTKLSQEDILAILRARLVEALTVDTKLSSFRTSTPGAPTVILVIGANGMGKTTTIGKLAHRIKSEYNTTVILGACDTFRAAAVSQLEEWALRANVSIVKPLPEEEGGDPVPVAVRTLRRAVQEEFGVAIIDTSGRLSNNFALTLQLQAIRDAITKEVPGAPHETLLVVDGAVGRNAVVQAEAWRKHVGVSGLVVTKLDGTARGGFVVSVVRDLGLPVKFVGVGESIDDLRDFQPELFVDALLGVSADSAASMQARTDRIFAVTQATIDSTAAAAAASSSSSARSAAERLKQSFGSDNDDYGNNDNPINTTKKTTNKRKKATPTPMKQKNKK